MSGALLPASGAQLLQETGALLLVSGALLLVSAGALLPMSGAQLLQETGALLCRNNISNYNNTNQNGRGRQCISITHLVQSAAAPEDIV